MNRSLPKIKTQWKWKKEFQFLEIMRKDLKCWLCLKYKEKFIRQKNFKPSRWRILGVHGKGVILQEESILNAS